MAGDAEGHRAGLILPEGWGGGKRAEPGTRRPALLGEYFVLCPTPAPFTAQYRDHCAFAGRTHQLPMYNNEAPWLKQGSAQSSPQHHPPSPQPQPKRARTTMTARRCQGGRRCGCGASGWHHFSRPIVKAQWPRAFTQRIYDHLCTRAVHSK